CWASPFASAIERQVACAAAISSSGLVLPPASSSKRDAKVTSSPRIAPLLSRSNRPEPLRRSPSHVAWARRSIAIVSLLFPRPRGPVVGLPAQLFREVVVAKPTRVVVRVDVALPAPELARARVAGSAQRRRRADVAVLAHVGGRLLQRDVRGIRFRRPREVDRGLRQVQSRLREADV